MPGLLSSNQSFRWLTAELLVVMLGILLAFQVEEWQEVRADRATERELLSGLRNEFVTNRQTLESMGSQLARQRASLQAFLYASPQDPASRVFQENRRDLIEAMHRTFTNQGMTHGYLNSVINSGNLALIDSVPLQAMLLEIEDIETELDLLADDIRMLTDNILIELGKYTASVVPLWDQSIPVDQSDEWYASETLVEMRGDAALVALLTPKTQRISPFIFTLNNLTDHLTALIELIDREIS